MCYERSNLMKNTKTKPTCCGRWVEWMVSFDMFDKLIKISNLKITLVAFRFWKKVLWKGQIDDKQENVTKMVVGGGWSETWMVSFDVFDKLIKISNLEITLVTSRFWKLTTNRRMSPKWWWQVGGVGEWMVSFDVFDKLIKISNLEI